MGSLRSRSHWMPATFAAARVALRWAWLKYAGTVITAEETSSPRLRSAIPLATWSTSALTSVGL